LRHFVVLAEEMHFGRAARRLFISQPALSTSVMRLEEQMQVRLFERDSKAVSMTLMGRAMLDRAKEIVSLADKLEQFGRAVAAGRAGVIEVGFTGTLLFRGLAPILKHFRDAFPEVDLSVRELTSQVQLDMLRSGRLDAAFVSSPVPPAGLASFVLFEERFVACLPQGHPLAAGEAVDVGQLRDEGFVMLSRDVSPAYYDHIVAMCASASFRPNVRIVAAHVPSVIALVASGLGVSLIPESVGRVAIPGAVCVPLEGAAKQATAFMAWNPERDVPGLASLIDTVRRDRGQAGMAPADPDAPDVPSAPA
jgi:DNA-binding transcriptional LysR family regulator